MIHIYEYYESIWGPPSREAEFTVLGLDIEIYKWDENATDMGATLYATNGASAFGAEGEANSHMVEFFAGFKPEVDSVADSLAILAAFPVKVKSIGVGETVTLQDPLWDGTKMHTFLTIPPLVETVPPLRIDGKRHVEFLHVVPLFESELELKKSMGAEWLLGELGDAGIRLSDPHRRALR